MTAPDGSNDDARRLDEEAWQRRVEVLREKLAAVRKQRDSLRAEVSALRAEQTDSSTVLEELRGLSSQITRTQQLIRHVRPELVNEIQSLDQLFRRFAPTASLPIVDGWALSPTGIRSLTDLVNTSDAEIVVECGSGTSTLWTAYALREAGHGKVIALDHLDEFATKTRETLAAHDLEKYAEVRHAPLTAVDTPRGPFDWYDVDPSSFDGTIDVLVVDGPPGIIGPHARYPALPLLGEHLSPGARILCDDMHRPDEREVLDFWMAEEPRLQRDESPSRGIEVLTLASTVA